MTDRKKRQGKDRAWSLTGVSCAGGIKLDGGKKKKGIIGGRVGVRTGSLGSYQ